MYKHLLILWIKGCQFFRNYMFYATHNNPFGLVLTAVNKVRRHMAFILDDMIMFLYRR